MGDNRSETRSDPISERVNIGDIGSESRSERVLPGRCYRRH